MTVRTRFAPSPTGSVHIGNVRVAIYNWLFARHHGGQFLLRLEDTDRERSTPEAVATVFDAMRWLGLDFDETPVYQSKTLDQHLAAAETLLSKGWPTAKTSARPARARPSSSACPAATSPSPTA
jgi:glutamyl-tRNA synthetase